MSQPVEFLSQPKAAARVGMCAATMRHLVKTGVGPAVTLMHKRPRIRTDELDKWVASRTARTPSDAASFGTAAGAMAAATEGANA